MKIVSYLRCIKAIVRYRATLDGEFYKGGPLIRTERWGEKPLQVETEFHRQGEWDSDEEPGM